MTPDQINAEIAKLTTAQRRALRSRFGTSGIEFLRCEEFLGRVDAVTVKFVCGVAYRVSLGPRGGLREVNCLGRA